MGYIAIAAEGIGKRYRIGGSGGQLGNLRESIMNAVAWPGRALRKAAQRAPRGENPMEKSEDAREFWALRDVSFEVRHGEVLGIIGRNGAGKSTLLKVLARITEPTLGRARVFGRVGSLLEVGSGFHPELTGRDNVFLNGAILGMKREEIRSKFDEIVAFAEVEKFIDTPVKHYSSGMYLRLAFAVAAHLNPEILFIDEVLAVGDASFQKKCLGKMGDVSRQGRTILFVSHNLTALKTLCSRAIWLSEGRLIDDGQADTVVSRYLREKSSSQLDRIWDDRNTAPGNDMVRLHRVRVVPETEDGSDYITVHTPLRIEFAYWNFVPGARLHVSFFLNSLEELCVFNIGCESAPRPVGLIRHAVRIPGRFLNDGSYYIRLLIVLDASIGVLAEENVVSFEVHDTPREGTAWYGKWAGAVRPTFRWETETRPE